MERRNINPTPWLNAFNIQLGVEVKGAERMLLLSGQTAKAADGSPQHGGDMVSQFALAWSNLKDALAEADMAPANVVRLNIQATAVASSSAMLLGSNNAVTPRSVVAAV